MKDLKEQIILEYLQQGCGYRKLQQKYGISRTTICKWVQIYQGIHGLERTQKQQNHYIRDMDDPQKKRQPKNDITNTDLEKKIAALENRTLKKHLQEGLILQQIDKIRKLQPRYGGRKLFIELQHFFYEQNIWLHISLTLLI